MFISVCLIFSIGGLLIFGCVRCSSTKSKSNIINKININDQVNDDDDDQYHDHNQINDDHKQQNESMNNNSNNNNLYRPKSHMEIMVYSMNEKYSSDKRK